MCVCCKREREREREIEEATLETQYESLFVVKVISFLPPGARSRGPDESALEVCIHIRESMVRMVTLTSIPTT